MLLTTKEYAEKYGLKQRTVQAYIRRGNLLAKQFGRFYLIEDTEKVSRIYNRKKVKE
jgi:excisionase family DNA binding protein